VADLELLIKGRIRHEALIISGSAFWAAAFFLASRFSLTWTMPLFYAAIMYSMFKMGKVIILLSKGAGAGVLQGFVYRNHLFISRHCCPTNFHANTKACCRLGGSGSGGLSSTSSSSDLRSNRLS